MLATAAAIERPIDRLIDRLVKQQRLSVCLARTHASLESDNKRTASVFCSARGAAHCGKAIRMAAHTMVTKGSSERLGQHSNDRYIDVDCRNDGYPCTELTLSKLLIEHDETSHRANPDAVLASHWVFLASSFWSARLRNDRCVVMAV